MYDPVGSGSERSPAWETPDVDVHPVCPVQAAWGHMGPVARGFRGPVFRFAQRLRAELQALGHRAPGPYAARPGEGFRLDGRQHLSGIDAAQSIVFV